MPKFLELAAPVHPFLTSSKDVSEEEIFDTHNENDMSSWNYRRDRRHDFESDTTPAANIQSPLSGPRHHHQQHPQERTRSESLHDDQLLSSPEAFSPAASFLSTFLTYPLTPSPLPDAAGQIVAGYVLGQTIGRGGFSTIKEGRSPSGDIVAIKVVRHNAFDNLPPVQRSRQKSRFTHEARIWASLSHENILPLFQSHQTASATYLITLYCPAGSLFDILKREGTPALEQTDAGCMFRQVVKGLQYMHETMGLVHCDVKLENVLVDESGVCRLTDFGLTKRVGSDPCRYSSDEEEDDYADEYSEEQESEDQLLHQQQPPSTSSSVSAKRRSRSRGRAGSTTLPVHLSLIRRGPQQRQRQRPLHAAETLIVPRLSDYSFPPGSLQYAAPELLLPRPSQDSRYTAHPAQDMWALGVLLYALLTGRLPFNDPFEPRLQMKIVKGTFDIPKGIGTHAETVLKGCLRKDVSQRWNISMVEDAAWGIGYGAVDIAPSIHEEQRQQSRSRTLSPLDEIQTQAEEELSNILSFCSVTSPSSPLSPLPPLSSPSSSSRRGRKFTNGTRSWSRSRSPSYSPHTPIDEEGLEFFSREQTSSCGSRRTRESGLQFVLDETTSTRGRSGRTLNVNTSTDEDACATIVTTGLLVPRSKSRSQSRTRSWSFNV